MSRTPNYASIDAHSQIDDIRSKSHFTADANNNWFATALRFYYQHYSFTFHLFKLTYRFCVFELGARQTENTFHCIDRH